MTLEAITVQDLLREANRLPTLPSVAMLVMELANDPTSAAEDLARIIEGDPTLAGRVLRIANSAYYGLSRKLDTVKQAVVVLGFNTVRSLAVSAAVMDKFRPAGVDFDWPALWQHSFAVGLASRVLARRIGRTREEEERFFTAGLLHDIGKVVLAQYFPDEFARIVRRLAEGAPSFYDAERETQGLTHAEVGGFLGTQWNLPDSIVRGIRFHHAPAEAKGDDDHIAKATHLANILVKTRGIGSGGDDCITGLDESAVAAMGIDDETLAEIVEGDLERELSESAELLEIFGKGI
ncbi:MAG: HD family phosphohydrolase [Actinomycetota bacterium]|nr:MAG: HD family phosphohydrolase [Actinomycetota bacterium]